MGSETQYRIPVIELPAAGSPDSERGSEGWQKLCKRVREACEVYGCFEVVYEKIPKKLREETFGVIRQLINQVPLERKQKNVNPKPYHSYYGPCSEVSLHEGLGIEDASNYDSVRNFAQLMGPDHGHLHFCQTMNTMVKQLEELNHMIWLMIIDSYGLGESTMMRYYMLLRVMKYMAPPSGEYSKALLTHTDTPATSIICEDQISGLEIEINDGEWIKLFPSPNSFVFLVGDALMAWSNGRMKAAKHRVMISGDRDRYSLGAFATPVEGTIIKAPKELVDDQHPQLFKEFDFMDFLVYTNSEAAKQVDSARQIFAFAQLQLLN